MTSRHTFVKSLSMLGVLVAIVAGSAWLAQSGEPKPPAPAPQQQQSAAEQVPSGPPVEIPSPLTKDQIKKKAAELRKKYPFESLSKRLAYEDRFAVALKDAPAPKLDEEATQHLQALEVAGRGHPFSGTGLRVRALEMLHSEQVERFISREGFGISRLPQPTTAHLELADTEPVRYPRYLLESTEGETTQFGKLPLSGQANPWNLPARDLLLGFHLNGQLEFANPNSLGLVRDRDHVAGFKPHQFRRVPELVSKWDREPRTPLDPLPKKVEEWVLRRLELVSLLKQEKPAVYVSTELPKMDDLRKAPTRELSSFETQSLKTLHSGESLVTRAKANHLEMFGALRAAKQCQACHEVQRGELLGAFSYELHRNPELKPGRDAASGGG